MTPRDQSGSHRDAVVRVVEAGVCGPTLALAVLEAAYPSPSGGDAKQIRDMVEVLYAQGRADAREALRQLRRIAFPGPYEGSAEWSRGVAWQALHSVTSDEKSA